MKTKGSQKKRANKRKRVGYDKREPEVCQNCKHFIKPFYSKPTKERFPPLCGLHEFQVDLLAVCRDWDDKVGPQAK